MQKRGQFYLLAAIVIIAVIVGFAGVSNYTQVRSHETVYNVGEELGIEGGNVVEYGVSEGDIQTTKFIDDYSQYADDPNRDIIFIFGTKDTLVGYTYEQLVTGGIFFAGSTGITGTEITTGEKVPINSEVDMQGNKITIYYKDETETEIPYEFKIKPGENFYFVVIQDIGDERIIIKSK